MWIRTGNVNVTSASDVVNGGSSAPNFITNGVKPGYMFRGPDGVLYEIETVVSETQLTLVSNYLGSTLTNQSYVIIQLSAAAYSEVLNQVIELLTLFRTSVSLTTLKVGSPTETAAMAAFLGTLFSVESTGDLRAYLSKNATGDDVWVEFAVAKSGRARLGLIGDNDIVLDYSTDGSAWTNVLTFDITTAPSNPRLSLNFPIVPKSYTIAGLPTSILGAIAHVSDLGGGAGPVIGDGTGWLPLRTRYETINTNADATLTALGNADFIRHTGTLTGDRVLTLSTTGARPGAWKHITRTGSGAFIIYVGAVPGLKTLAQNQWAKVVFDGSAWYLAAYGAL